VVIVANRPAPFQDHDYERIHNVHLLARTAAHGSLGGFVVDFQKAVITIPQKRSQRPGA